MRLSVTSWSFPALTLTEAWHVAQAMGIGAIDIGLHHGPALDRAAVLADPTGEAARLDAAGLRVANVYWMFGDGPQDRAVSDADSRDRNLAEMEQVVPFAAALGCPSIFVLPGVKQAGQSVTSALDTSAATLGEMTALAEKAGVQMLIEPHVGGILQSPEAALAHLERVPGLKLALDYAHFACMGVSQNRIDMLAPHAGHVHMRQARPGALQAKWGEGTLDFGRMVETLRTAGYDEYLSIEYVHQAYMNTLTDDVLTETVRMRDCLNAELANG